MSVYGLLLFASKLIDGAHGTTAYVYPASFSWHTLMPGHDGYPRVSSLLLSRTSSTETLPGFTDAGSTCLPFSSLLKQSF